MKQEHIDRIKYGQSVIFGTLDQTSDYPITHKTAAEKCSGCNENLGYDVELVCVEMGTDDWDVMHRACFEIKRPT